MQLSSIATAASAVLPVAGGPRPSERDLPRAHAEARERSAADLTGGDEGAVHTETLPNGVRLVVAERPGARSTKVQIGIGAGALQDPPGKEGIAHLLEHMAFEGSPTRTAGVQERIRMELGGEWNAFTNQGAVVYYGVVPGAQARDGARLITDMFRNPATSGPRLAQERAAVKNEMVFPDGTIRAKERHIAARLLHGDHPAVTNVIGTRRTIDAITPGDLRAWHRQHYVGRNTVALVEGDPKRLPLDVLRRELGSLPAGVRVDNSGVDAPVQPGRALQVINDPSVDTVNLEVMLPVPAERLGGVRTPAALIQKALDERLGLRLRRQQDLTYGVRSELSLANEDNLLLKVRTSVPKQHAREAVRTILETLQDARDGFGEKTFETHRAGTLAALRKAEPSQPLSTSERAELAFMGALDARDIEVPPSVLPDPAPGQLRHALGRLDARQFAKDMDALISFDDMKVLAVGALADGGAQVRGGLRDAGIDLGGLAMNPVDLKPYREMGLRVTRQTVPPLR